MLRKSRQTLLIRMILPLLLIGLLSGCSGITEYQKSIYDDDAKIAKQGDSFFFKNRVGNSLGNSLSISFGGFTGKQTIWRVDTDNAAAIDLDLNCLITGGNFKICLIDASQNVSIIAEGVIDELKQVQVPEGKNYITIVGQAAAGEIDLAIEGGQGVSIQKVEDD